MKINQDPITATRTFYKVAIVVFFLVSIISIFTLFQNWPLLNILNKLLSLIWIFFYIFIVYFFWNQLEGMKEEIKPINEKELDKIFKGSFKK